ncbi:MAG: hypothetical protein Q7T14_09535 [Aestuariivirga sp.]|nr:hypothetical protein [Aestuariivirga sp.]
MNFMARTGFKRFGGSKTWKERVLLPPPFPMTFPAAMGREGASFTTNIPGGNDDEAADGGFSRSQHTQHGAVQGAWNP